MKKKFKLRAPGETKFFTVMIYDKIIQLRKDANKYNIRKGAPADNDDVLGVVHPFELRLLSSDGSERKSNKIGIIRLCTKHLRGSIVAHETLHAAFWQYRLSRPDKLADFGKDNSEKEEEFCHLFDKLSWDMTRKLYKHKFWN